MEYHAQLVGVNIRFIKWIDQHDTEAMLDKMRCQQIIINLLQNAIKFSSKGQTIELYVEEFEIKGQSERVGINIKVSDNGVGISENDRKNLFQMYF